MVAHFRSTPLLLGACWGGVTPGVVDLRPGARAYPGGGDTHPGEGSWIPKPLTVSGFDTSGKLAHRGACNTLTHDNNTLTHDDNTLTHDDNTMTHDDNTMIHDNAVSSTLGKAD